MKSALIKKLCEQVLALDKKAFPGPWGNEAPFTNNDDSRLISHYRTSAPQLASALLKCIEALEFYSNTELGVYRGELVHVNSGSKARQVLSEIEKVNE